MLWNEEIMSYFIQLLFYFEKSNKITTEGKNAFLDRIENFVVRFPSKRWTPAKHNVENDPS